MSEKAAERPATLVRFKENWRTFIPGWIPICGVLIGIGIQIGGYKKTIDSTAEAIVRIERRLSVLEAAASETRGYVLAQQGRGLEVDAPARKERQ